MSKVVPDTQTETEATPEYTVVMSGNSFWVVLAIMISLDLFIIAAIVNGLKQDAIVQVSASSSSAPVTVPITIPLPPPTPLKRVEL